MIRSELLRICYSLPARILLAVVVAQAFFVGMLFAFLPALTDALISLNDVIPNATSADQFSDAQLALLSFASADVQTLVIDLLGNIGTGASIPAIAALLFGALTITGEHRRGSLTPTVLAEPRRIRLIVIKLAALSISAIAAAALLAIVHSLTLTIGLAAQHEPLRISASDIAQTWGTGVLALILYTLIGFAGGLLLRSPVTALVTFGAVLVAESIIRPITALIIGTPNPTQYLPTGLIPDLIGTDPLAALAGTDASLITSIGAAAAIITLLAWTVLLLAITTVRFVRADIPAQEW